MPGDSTPHPPTRTIACRCDAVAQATENGTMAYCAVHDKAAPYPGPPVRPGADPYGPGLAW